MNTVHRVTVDRPVDDVFAHPNGLTTMTSHAAFEPNGSAGLVAALRSPAFDRLGDEAEKGLRVALLKL